MNTAEKDRRIAAAAKRIARLRDRRVKARAVVEAVDASLRVENAQLEWLQQMPTDTDLTDEQLTEPGPAA